jgi:hypothetical protein
MFVLYQERRGLQEQLGAPRKKIESATGKRS